LNRLYFYEDGRCAKIETGSLSYVLGRKGSGKTAIAEHLLNQQSYNTFARKLSFTHFPFNILSQFSDDSYSTDSRYMNIWKYLIYNTVLELFVNNESIDSDLRKRITAANPKTIEIALADYVRFLADGGFNLDILQFGIGGSKSYETVTNNTPLYRRVAILEQILLDHIDTSTYHILFDDLDEDFNNNSTKTDCEYLRLIASLFKAISNVRSGPLKNVRVFPVLFLRTDIFNLIQSSNRTKWTDSMYRLDWQTTQLKALVTHRIDVAKQQAKLNIDDTTLRYRYIECPQRNIRRKSNSRELFEVIGRHTFRRPRDFIAFYRIAARQADQLGVEEFNERVVKCSEKEYSQHILNELNDEIFAYVPDFSEAIRALASPGKASVPFNRALQLLQQRKTLLQEDPVKIIHSLVEISVLGKSLPQPNQWAFKYQNEYISVGEGDNLYFHPSMHAALDVR
jgi:hypothetical protein